MLQRYSPIHWWQRPPPPTLTDLRIDKAGALVINYGARIGVREDIAKTAAFMARQLVREGHTVHRAYMRAMELLDKQSRLK